MSEFALGAFLGLAGWSFLGMVLTTLLLGETQTYTWMNVAVSAVFMLWFLAIAGLVYGGVLP